ncbi:MAG: hypothetical protein VKP63_05490 [Cyanobacteriota bacterium]|nr:hypothetical protein [Cyanobacteriota bacterium]
MVGVDVGVEGGDQIDAQFADQGEIAVVPLEHRIDHHALAAGEVGEEVGEGAGFAVEELAQEEGAATRGGGQGQPGGSGRSGAGGRSDGHGDLVCNTMIPNA